MYVAQKETKNRHHLGREKKNIPHSTKPTPLPTNRYDREAAEVIFPSHQFMLNNYKNVFYIIKNTTKGLHIVDFKVYLHVRHCRFTHLVSRRPFCKNMYSLPPLIHVHGPTNTDRIFSP